MRYWQVLASSEGSATILGRRAAPDPWEENCPMILGRRAAPGLSPHSPSFHSQDTFSAEA